MLTAIALVEAAGASAGFIWITRRYVHTRTLLRAATWRADTLQALEDRRTRRRTGEKKRDGAGRFAA